MTSLVLFILSLPTFYELYVERKGEAMKTKKWSMFIRVVISVTSVWIAAVFKNDLFWLDVLKSAALSFGIFIVAFDYLINLILGRKPWYSYLSKSPIDKVVSRVDWRVRMAVRVLIFITAMIWFIS